MRINNFNNRSVWYPLTGIAVVVCSFVLSWHTHSLIDPSRVDTIFGVFAFLPFSASVFLFLLRKQAQELSGSDLLSDSELRRVTETISHKAFIYSTMGYVNIIAGSAMVVTIIFQPNSAYCPFILVFSMYMAISTILLCWQEDGHYAEILNYLKSRKVRQDNKNKILAQMSKSTNF